MILDMFIKNKYQVYKYEIRFLNQKTRNFCGKEKIIYLLWYSNNTYMPIFKIPNIPYKNYNN